MPVLYIRIFPKGVQQGLSTCVKMCVCFPLRGSDVLTVIQLFPHNTSLSSVCVCVCLPSPYYLHQPGRHLTSGEGPRYAVIKASEEREQERDRIQGVYVCVRIAK